MAKIAGRSAIAFLTAVMLLVALVTARPADAITDTVIMPGQPNSCFVDQGEPASEIELSALWTPAVPAAVTAVSVKVDANDVDPPMPPAFPEGEIDIVSLNGQTLGSLTQGATQSADTTTIFNLTTAQIAAIFGGSTTGLTLEAAIDVGAGTDTAIIYCLKVYDIEITIDFVQANSPPSCDDAEPSVAVLWPANQGLVAVSIVGVTDADNDAVTISIDKVRQDESVNDTGDGNASPDGAGVGTSTALLRAERAGAGDGRVYHVSFSADDGNGGTCTGTVKVTVPRDQGNNDVAIDGGPLFDSTQP